MNQVINPEELDEEEMLMRAIAMSLEDEEKEEKEEEEEWAGRLGSGAGAGCSAKTCARLLCCDQVVGMHWSHYCILRKVITYHLVARNILGFRPLPKSVVIMLKGKMGW